MYQRQCLWCGKDFEAAKETAEFHSNACKQAYWRWKHNLALEVARVKDNLKNVHRYTDHPVMADAAWAELYKLREHINGLLRDDPSELWRFGR